MSKFRTIQSIEKSNEKTAIPELFGAIELENAVVSIDAMGTHDSIARLIYGKGGNYLLSLKKNQKNLYKEVFDWFKSRKYLMPTHTDTDYVAGRIESRTTYVTTNLMFIDELSNWTGVKSIIMLESKRDFKNGKQKSTTQTRFYVSFLDKEPAYFYKAVRHYWSIENQLHCPDNYRNRCHF